MRLPKKGQTACRACRTGRWQKNNRSITPNDGDSRTCWNSTPRTWLDWQSHATDGNFGSLADIYFDDVHWQVRYFVVDTGIWLPGRLVLISPASGSPRPYCRPAIERDADQGPDRKEPRHPSGTKQTRGSTSSTWRNTTAGRSIGRSRELAPDVDDVKPGDVNLTKASEVKEYHVHAKDGRPGTRG